MKIKGLTIVILLTITMSSIGVMDIQKNTQSNLEILEMEQPILAQDDEIVIQNISSYLDFALATGSIMTDKLIRSEDGTVFHNADYSYSIFLNGSTLSDYYWSISSLSKLYEITGNTTIAFIISRMALKMIETFGDTEYPGYFINTWSDPILVQTKRAGIQAYAYEALSIAEDVNASLDFTDEKQSAIDCLTNVLYDTENGGFYFFTLRDGSLVIPGYIDEVYPNDGKRLDHLALGISTLYNAGEATGNDTLTAMANESLSFMIKHMSYFNQTSYFGMKLAVNVTGGDPVIAAIQRPARTVLSDINAMAIRALVTGYQVTGNTTYLDWAEDTLNAILLYNWDNEDGGWFAETLDGEPYDVTFDEDVLWFKYSEIQFQMIITLEALYEVTLYSPYIQLIIDALDIALANLWDRQYGGFVRNSDRSGAVPTDAWKEHLVAVQGLGFLVLERMWSYGLPIISNVRVAPTNPRPHDDILFLVIALDNDGIDSVIVNMTIVYEDDSVNNTFLELEPNADISGVFNNTIGTLPDGAKINFIVFVNDTNGNIFIAGSYFFNVKVDVYAPVVLLRTLYPSDEIFAGENVFIEIGTFEYPSHSLTESCVLYWKLNDGDYSPMNMTWIDVDIDYLVWIADIGYFDTDDVISFYVLVVDEAGNIGESPFYRLTILGFSAAFDPVVLLQVVLAVGLVTAPGVGYLFVRGKRESSKQVQRELKRAQRKRTHRGPTTRRKRGK